MPVLADSLSKLSARQVLQDLEALHEEKRLIEEQEAVLAEILAIKEEHARDDAAKVAAPPRTRDIIRELFGKDPSHTWSPIELQEALHAKGVEITRKNLGVTLHRMVASGEVAQPGRGEYKLASPNGDTPNLGRFAVNDPASSRASGVRTSDE